MSTTRAVTVPANPQTTSVAPRLLTVPQAADYLNTTVWQVRTLVWTRELPAVKLGKRLLVDRGDLDEFVDRLRGRA